jgi:hypothetical protein
MANRLERNRATQSLYALLAQPESRDAKMPIYAHSQGNLIASNTLYALSYTLGSEAVHGWKVASFGSPAVMWPAGLDRADFSFTLDPIGWLNFIPRWSNVKVGWVAAHGFLTYLKHDAEFTINKHRVKWGATFNFDEKGLAGELISWGVNPLRLWGVFYYLSKYATADADDVAYWYVKGLQEGHKLHVLQELSRCEPDVPALVHNCLTGGWWVTSGERQLGELLNAVRKGPPERAR